MKPALLQGACGLSLSLLLFVPARAGTCFLWNERDGQSCCAENVDSEDECEQLRVQLGFDQAFWISNAASGCRDGLPWSIELCDGDHPYIEDPWEDPNPADPHDPMLIEWRYVVDVTCEQVGDDCVETQQLLTCGCDPQADPPHH